MPSLLLPCGTCFVGCACCLVGSPNLAPGTAWPFVHGGCSASPFCLRAVDAAGRCCRAGPHFSPVRIAVRCARARWARLVAAMQGLSSVRLRCAVDSSAVFVSVALLRLWGRVGWPRPKMCLVDAAMQVGHGEAARAGWSPTRACPPFFLGFLRLSSFALGLPMLVPALGRVLH